MKSIGIFGVWVHRGVLEHWEVWVHWYYRNIRNMGKLGSEGILGVLVHWDYGNIRNMGKLGSMGASLWEYWNDESMGIIRNIESGYNVLILSILP